MELSLNCISATSAHSKPITDLSYNPRFENVLFSSSADDSIKIWKQEEALLENFQSYNIHLNGVNRAMWNKDGNFIVSSGNDSMLNILDINKEKVIRNYWMDSVVTSLDVNYASSLVLTGSENKYICMLDVRCKHNMLSILSHSEPITDVKFSEDSKIYMSISHDGFIRFWDVFKWQCLKTMTLEKSPPLSRAEFLAIPNYLMVSSLNDQIQIIDILTEEVVVKFTGHKNSDYLLDFQNVNFPNQKTMLFSPSECGNLFAWDVDLESNSPKIFDNVLPVMSDEEKILNCFSFSKDTKKLALSFFPNSKNEISIFETIWEN